tara:strand:- start:112180 stop:113412 length:1233 start_codon:yes stop_codon:yes gene_type:complete
VTSGSDVESNSSEDSNFNRSINNNIELLEAKINDLTTLSQELLTEKLFLENEVIQLKKRASRLDEEISNLRSPPLIVGNIQDFNGDYAIVRSSNGTVFQVSFNQRIDPVLLKPGARVSLNQDSLSIIDVLSDSWDTLVTTSEVIEKPLIRYSEIGGLDSEIMKLKDTIELPLKNPELFEKMGIEAPKGVLLCGPPGTGKTMLAKAVANATNATFLGIVGSELAQKYIGEGGRLVRELFDLARDKSPSIIFIDEIDAIGSKRLDSSTSGDREVQRTLMQLLAELDGFSSLKDVKIIAATNRPELLDKALLRPGRFDRIIEIGLPDYQGRLQILKIITKNVPLTNGIKLESISKKTDGFSGADLKSLILESGMKAITDGNAKISLENLENALIIVNNQKKESVFGDPSALYG